MNYSKYVIRLTLSVVSLQWYIILVQEKKCENDEDCKNMFRQTCNVESGICFESDGKRGLHTHSGGGGTKIQ